MASRVHPRAPSTRPPPRRRTVSRVRVASMACAAEPTTAKRRTPARHRVLHELGEDVEDGVLLAQPQPQQPIEERADRRPRRVAGLGRLDEVEADALEPQLARVLEAALLRPVSEILPLVRVLARIGRVAVLGPLGALRHRQVADVAVALAAGFRVIRRGEGVERAVAARVRERREGRSTHLDVIIRSGLLLGRGLEVVLIINVLGVLGRVAKAKLDLRRVDAPAEDRRGLILELHEPLPIGGLQRRQRERRRRDPLYDVSQRREGVLAPLRVEVERRQPQTLGADGGAPIALRQRPQRF